jgi:hypothetical protein
MANFHYLIDGKILHNNIFTSSAKVCEDYSKRVNFIHSFIHSFTNDSIAFVNLSRFFSFLFYTQSLGLLGGGISPSQGPYLHTGQYKHRIKSHRYTCREWDSNPQPKCSSERRQLMP